MLLHRMARGWPLLSRLERNANNKVYRFILPALGSFLILVTKRYAQTKHTAIVKPICEPLLFAAFLQDAEFHIDH